MTAEDLLSPGQHPRIEVPVRPVRLMALIRLRDKKVVVVRPGTYGEVTWVGPNMLAAIALTRNGLHARGIELLDISAGLKWLSG